MNYSFLMKNIEDHPVHNVGQCFWILSVNRTTGEVVVTYDNPWPEHNRKAKEELDKLELELCEDGWSLREKK